MKENFKKHIIGIWMLFVILPATASPIKGKEVRDIIDKVNTYWQEKNTAESSSSWKNAAYHTGNMEVYFLTGNEKYRAYSEAWANYNHWAGTAGKNKAEWKYAPGETDEYVLFSDNQACFQTYIDLYMITGDGYRIARTREVMDYQVGTKQSDYLSSCDGLYMVMPVLSKLYKQTNDITYLNKLYEYMKYTDNIIFDEDENLYYRDVKYVYPQHKSFNGKKDFQASSDGWFFAGLAKVLKDLPVDYAHRDFFINKYKDMAKAIVELQQREGYWTRSMMDSGQAAGPETSSTALFTYGLLWGINNNYLDKTVYLPVVNKAWIYLSKVALQKDGCIGYVQPVGENTSREQALNSRSATGIGVGAFLLAACEYVRYLDSGNDTTRRYWTDLAWRMAEPVLSNMAEGKLHQNMTIEVSPNWDGRVKDVAYMEAFGRLMSGIAPWLSLPDDNTEEGKKRYQLRRWALESYKNAVDPHSPDYLLWHGHTQALVDAAYIAESFLRGYDQLWVPLDDTTKKRYIEEFIGMRRYETPYNNWLLFSAIIESFLAKAGAPHDQYRLNIAIRKMEEWYLGDGMYADGQGWDGDNKIALSFDYYSSYVIHAMYLETLQACVDANIKSGFIDYRRYYSRALKRAQRFALILERFISPEGTFPVLGRSITYRLAAMQPLALMGQYQELPAGIINGQVRAGLTAIMEHMFAGNDNFNEKGFLVLGFKGHQPGIADVYTDSGSLYMTSLAFLPLGLPATHPFWTDASRDWTSKRAWTKQPFPIDHHWSDQK